MLDATICTYPNGDNGIIVWKDRDNPTQEELLPPNTEIHKHAILPNELVCFIQRGHKDQVQKILADYLPKVQTH